MPFRSPVCLPRKAAHFLSLCIPNPEKSYGRHNILTTKSSMKINNIHFTIVADHVYTWNSLPISGGGIPTHPNTLFLVFYTEVIRYPETRGRYFKGWCRRYTEQEVGAHICFTAIFQAMERRLSWYGLRGIPEPDWAVKHMCAPTSCSVYLLHHLLKYLPFVSSGFFIPPLVWQTTV